MNRVAKTIGKLTLALALPACLLFAGTGCDEEQMLRQIIGVVYEEYVGGYDSYDDGDWYEDDGTHDDGGYGHGWEDDSSDDGEGVQIIPPAPIPAG